MADIISLKTVVRAALRLSATSGLPGAVPDDWEDALDWISGADVLPVSGREVEEGQKLIPVLDQLGCRPLLFYLIGLDEAIECRFGLFPGFCHPNVMKVGLGLLDE